MTTESEGTKNGDKGYQLGRNHDVNTFPFVLEASAREPIDRVRLAVDPVDPGPQAQFSDLEVREGGDALA